MQETVVKIEAFGLIGPDILGMFYPIRRLKNGSSTRTSRSLPIQVQRTA